MLKRPKTIKNVLVISNFKFIARVFKNDCTKLKKKKEAQTQEASEIREIRNKYSTQLS